MKQGFESSRAGTTDSPARSHTEKLTIISPFEHLTNGDSFEGNNWPLHVTLFTWFDIPADFEEFDRALRELQSDIQSIKLVGGEKTLFGPDQDVPVRLVGDENELRTVHEKIMSLVESHGSKAWNEAFVGAGYRPHVTDTSTNQFSKDETATLTTMNLIKGDVDGIRVVVGTYGIGTA